MIPEKVGVAHIRLQHVHRLVPGHVSHLEDGGAPVPAILTSLGIDQRGGKRQVASLMGLGSRARGVAGEFHLQGGEYGLWAGGRADLDRHLDEGLVSAPTGGTHRWYFGHFSALHVARILGLEPPR
jgi:hypothetical protein